MKSPNSFQHSRKAQNQAVQITIPAARKANTNAPAYAVTAVKK